MKLLVCALSAIILSACSKDTIIEDIEPEVKDFEVTVDNSTGAARPKIKFAAIVPDTSKVATLFVVRFYQGGAAGTGIDSVLTIESPVSKEYSAIDTTTTYPFTDQSIYIFSFRMKDAGIKAFIGK